MGKLEGGSKFGWQYNWEVIYKGQKTPMKLTKIIAAWRQKKGQG